MRLKFAVAFTLAALPVLSQTPGPVNLFGTVERFDGTALTVIAADTNAVETYTALARLLVLKNRSVTLAEIRPNDFVASAASRGPDGQLHSLEVRIFPEALRGAGEGQRPMDEANSRTMTNATVTGTALVGGSNKITVTFPGGQSELIVDPGVPVTRLESVGPELIRPGVKVRLQGARTEGGATVNRITILD